MLKSDIVELLSEFDDDQEIDLIVADCNDNWEAVGVDVNAYGGELTHKCVELVMQLSESYAVTDDSSWVEPEFVDEIRTFADADEFAAELKKGKCYSIRGSDMHFYYEPSSLNRYRVGDLNESEPIADWFFCDGSTVMVRIQVPE